MNKYWLSLIMPASEIGRAKLFGVTAYLGDSKFKSDAWLGKQVLTELRTAFPDKEKFDSQTKEFVPGWRLNGVPQLVSCMAITQEQWDAISPGVAVFSNYGLWYWLIDIDAQEIVETNTNVYSPWHPKQLYKEIGMIQEGKNYV